MGVSDSLLRHLTAYKTEKAEQIVNNIPGTSMGERKEGFRGITSFHFQYLLRADSLLSTAVDHASTWLEGN